MLVLTRREGQSIRINGPCVVTLVSFSGSRATIGIEADPEVQVIRGELQPNQPNNRLPEVKPVMPPLPTRNRS